jgi:hypothetical protein
LLQSLFKLSLLLLLVFITGCESRPPPEQQAALFCETLSRVNSGGVDTRGLAELQGHAKVLKTLLDVAPQVIEKELAQFHSVFDSWAAAVIGEKPMIDTFEELSDPSLVGAEGRVADYIAEHCDVRLGDGYYNESPRGESDSICPGWPRFISPLNSNNFPNLPDISGANYFANDFVINPLGVGVGRAFGVKRGGWVEFRGQYPRARYFAYHPNDMDLNNLDTLQDRELNPDPGSVNPYREVAEPGSKNYYTAKLVFDESPKNPEPNTSYVGLKKNTGDSNYYLINMLRLYASDIGDGANSGGVPLPAITIYKPGGEVAQHFDECELYGEGREPIRSELTFPAIPIIDHRAREKVVWNTSSNFNASSDTMANADAQYLSAYYSTRFGDLFVMRGKYVTAPNTRAGVPHSAAGYDIRGYTLCTYNIWAGSAIDCMLDNEMTVGDDGFYTLVISDEQNKPANLQAQQATWLDKGVYLDGQLSIRYVFRDNLIAQAIAKGVMGDNVTEALRAYVPVAVPCDSEVFATGGWKACFARQGVDIQP